MSVENKIRELLSGKLNEAAFPGAGKNMEASAPMQGSSQKPNVELMHKGMGGQTSPSTASATMKARGGAAEMAPMKQGSSQDAPIASRDDQATQGLAHGKRAKKMPVPGQRGAGQAPNYSTVADPGSVINQSSSKGNVAQEDVEMDEGDFITEEEFEALSPEEQEMFELAEMEDDMGDEGDFITEEEFEALSPEEQEMYEPFDGEEDVEEMTDEEIEEFLADLSDEELDQLLADDEELEEQFDDDFEDDDVDEDLLESVLAEMSDEELADLLEEALEAADLSEEDVEDFFLEAAEQNLTDDEAVAAFQQQVVKDYVTYNVLLAEGEVKSRNKMKKKAWELQQAAKIPPSLVNHRNKADKKETRRYDRVFGKRPRGQMPGFLPGFRKEALPVNSAQTALRIHRSWQKPMFTGLDSRTSRSQIPKEPRREWLAQTRAHRKTGYNRANRAFKKMDQIRSNLSSDQR